jgi:hypothetical protein
MTEAGSTTNRVHQPTAFGGYVTPIITGVLIAAAGLVPWTLLAQVNARVRPDLPWAAVASLAYLVVLLVWLNGSGPRLGDVVSWRFFERDNRLCLPLPTMWPNPVRDSTLYAKKHSKKREVMTESAVETFGLSQIGQIAVPSRT